MEQAAGQALLFKHSGAQGWDVSGLFKPGGKPGLGPRFLQDQRQRAGKEPPVAAVLLQEEQTLKC